MSSQLQAVGQYDRKGLLDEVLSQFRISTDGVHGPSHWARVRHHGLAVGVEVCADLLVVELFAFLHDSQRRNEFEDDLHGERAAEYAASMNRRFFDLQDTQLTQLVNAIRFHSDGDIHQCSTIQTCWDADRLDLGRVGIKPSARFLSPLAAKHIQTAYEWSKL
jgi:uncharacterized protein